MKIILHKVALVISLVVLVTFSALAQKFGNGTSEENAAHRIGRGNQITITQEPAPKKKQNYNFNRAKRLKNRMAKPHVEFGLTFSGSYTSITSEANLQLKGDAAYLNGEQVGYFSSTESGNGFRNELTINEQQYGWNSSERAGEYAYSTATAEPVLVFGVNSEIRIVQESFNGVKKGYFFNVGAMVMNVEGEPIEQLNKRNLFFPVGMGFIIPGEPNFRIEMGGSGLVNFQGVHGGKFDFSLVLGNVIKIGPSFTFVKTNGSIQQSFAAPGIHFGFLPGKL